MLPVMPSLRLPSLALSKQCRIAVIESVCDRNAAPCLFEALPKFFIAMPYTLAS